jgi:fatty acid desaturase
MSAPLTSVDGIEGTGAVAATGRTIFPGSPALTGLRTGDGLGWREFRRGLQPRFGVVWCDIAGRFALTALGYAVACAVAALAGNAIGLALLPLTSAWMGFWFGSVVLFMHEAAHYNLHPDKTLNDRLANVFVCILTGDDVKHYRALHWKHHLHLGETDDTEISYHWAPTIRFMLETLSGVHAWRVFKAHRRARVLDAKEPGTRQRDFFALARGIALHAVIAGVPLLFGWYSASLAWVVAVAVVFPFVSALRQQLEHRSEEASAKLDYSIIPHGAVNRMFEGSSFARSFGSAGFSRHLLHHWDPSVSYTRFTDFEAFLMKTDFAPLVDDARTSYVAVWRQLARDR